MSLFPAYSGEKKIASPSEQWLNNSSFKINLTQVPSSSSQNRINNENETEGYIKDTHQSKRKKKKSKKQKYKSVEFEKEEKTKSDDDDFGEQDFVIDVKASKQMILPTARLMYRVKYNLSPKNKITGRKFRRYFHFHYEAKSKEDEEPSLTVKDLEKPIGKDRDEFSTAIQQEEEMSKKTEVLNRSLSENPHDVELWLKYVRFQDKVFQFEKTYRKGSFAKGLRVMAERKIVILDKALSHNPDSEILMRERLRIYVSVYPSDELEVELKKLVDKDIGNIVWWQGYIEASQCSMSRCNTPTVLQLYSKCLSTLHQLRRNSTVEKSRLEENILRMLYQCGLFLKQSGLFEQLWTLLRLYLELNLSSNDRNKFNIGSRFDEKQLFDLEEVVLKSQLPIHELWLRIEKLREAGHWLPYSDHQNCEDPQRLVFTEDVSELIHPITMPGNTFKLTAIILTLLKTPLLPCRHTTMQDLGLDYVPWALDSVETLLPLFFPIHPIDLTNKNLLRDTQRLCVGPQYLKTFPGQEEYLEFLLQTMRNCIDCLNDKDKLAVMVWWFRYQRLLIVLDRENRFKMSASFKKKIKTNIKQLLKTDEHRNNVILYQEYALIEFEFGNHESAFNILTTALSIHGENQCVFNVTIEKIRAEMCLLYRTLVELYLKLPTDSDLNKQKALKYLATLNLGSIPDENLSDAIIEETTLKFKHITLVIQQEPLETLMAEDYFLPNFFTDWIICNGWFIYLTKGLIDCGIFIEEVIEKIDAMNWHKEVLYEFYVTVLFKHCLENFGSGMFQILDDVLYKAIESFPNNIYFMSVLAKERSLNHSQGISWWKMTKLLTKIGHAIPSLFLVLISHQRIFDIEENWIDTVTGRQIQLDNGYQNRMLSLFRELTSTEMCTRRCGLIWRLYLQFLNSYFDPVVCREAYYCAVAECPWLKALYIDAAIYIPGELAQIQDLIIEKQLRLHITPEELDVLRS